jgi:hypothetical protein
MRRRLETPQKQRGNRESGHTGHYAGTKRVWRRYRLAPTVAAALFALATGYATAARADSLVQYQLGGQPGDQAQTLPTSALTGLTGVALTRGPGLTPSAANNSMSASGWVGPNADDFFQFGFNVTPGNSAVVDSLRFATRSSNTGPGFVNVLYTVDGGPETLITTLTQPGTNFVNSVLTFAPISVNSSFRILLRSANNTSANGGTVAAAGTLRIGDYSPDAGQSFEPVTISGRVLASATAPESGSLALLTLTGLPVAAGIVRRRRAA